MLNIINKSPLDRSSLDTCLQSVEGGAILLIEDGVYAATKAGAASAGLAEALARLKVYALRPDLEARGVAAALADGVTAIDYTGFVDLVAEHPNNQTWL